MFATHRKMAHEKASAFFQTLTGPCSCMYRNSRRGRSSGRRLRNHASSARLVEQPGQGWGGDTPALAPLAGWGEYLLRSCAQGVLHTHAGMSCREDRASCGQEGPRLSQKALRAFDDTGGCGCGRARAHVRPPRDRHRILPRLPPNLAWALTSRRPASWFDAVALPSPPCFGARCPCGLQRGGGDALPASRSARAWPTSTMPCGSTPRMPTPGGTGRLRSAARAVQRRRPPAYEPARCRP